MPRKIDTAVVEYIPEFGQFVRNVDRELGRSFDRVERIAETSAENIEDSFNELERDITRVFDDIARTGAVDMAALTEVANRTANQVGDEFQQGGEEAENAFGELRRTANRELDRIDKDVDRATSGVRSRFNAMGLAAGAAVGGIALAATAGIGAITTFGLISAAQLEQVRVSFDSLLGSADLGGETFRQLQEFAAATPFEFPEIANAAKRFLTFNEAVGLSNADLEMFLTTVGNITSVTGAGAEGLNRIAFAIGQIASRGRVQLEEINQISEAIPGFSALGAIAEKFGITTAEAMDKISAGEVDAVAGVDAILEGMAKFPGAAGAMEKQAQTLQGVFSTFKDTVSIALADAFAPVLPSIKEALVDITPVIGDALGRIAPLIGDLLTAIAPLISGLVELLVPVLEPILEALGPALTELAPAMVPLGEALGELTVALVPLIPLLVELLKITALSLVPTIELLARVLGLLEPVINAVTSALSFFSDLLQPMADNVDETMRAVGDIFMDTLEDVEEFFRGLDDWFDELGRWFAALPGRIWGFIQSIPSLVGKAFGMAFDMAMKAIGVGIALIYLAVTELPGLIMDGLVALPGLLWGFFTNLWKRATTVTEETGKGILDWVLALPGRIANAVRALPGVVGHFFHSAFENAKSIVSGAVNSIVGFMINLPGRISGFAVSVGSGIVNFFRNTLNRAIDGLNSGIATIDAIIPGSLPRLPRLAHGGIAMGPAIVGEDTRTTPEAAIPLGDSRAMAMLVEAFANARGGGPTSATNNFTVLVEIDGQQLEGRVVSVMDERDRKLKRRVTARRGY